MSAPPTDAPAPADASEGPEPPAAPRPELTGYAIAGTLLFASLAGPLLFYFLGWRYRPLAVHHLPATTAFAARLDGRELFQFEPFQRHILPLLDDAPGTAGRAEILKKHTGIDLRDDVKEVVVSITQDGEVVVLVGGRFEGRKFKRVPFVDGLERTFAESHVEGFSRDGELLVGHGLAIAQAEDTTLVVGSSPALTRASLGTSDAWRGVGLPTSGAASLVVTRAGLELAAARSSGRLAEALSASDRLSAYLKLKRQPMYFADATPRDPAQLAELTDDVTAALADADALAALLPNRLGERDALGEGMRTKSRASSVMIEGFWPTDGLGRAVEEAGLAARAVLDGNPASPPGSPR